MRIRSVAGPSRRHRRRLVAAAAVVAALTVGAGCSASTEDTATTEDTAAPEEATPTDDTAPTDDTTTIEETTPAEEDADPLVAIVDDATRAHVAFEVAWQCDLTRFAFDDLADIDVMREERLDTYAISEADHDDFLARLDREPDLAELVAELSGDCAGTDTDTEADGPVEL